MGNPAAMLLLADGRFPAGGHAHSGGVEAAVVDGRVVDEITLEGFVRARLATTGLVEAALAAATVLHLGPSMSVVAGNRLSALDGGTEAHRPPAPVTTAARLLAELDVEAEARLAPPPLRVASRRLGRQLVRAALRCWPHPLLDLAAEAAPGGLHQPVALGATGVAAGLPATDVARLAVHHAITTPAQAAVRLLGLDPFSVAALTARLSGAAAGVVDHALLAASGPLADLPARAGPLLDIAAVEHNRRDARLFAT